MSDVLKRYQNIMKTGSSLSFARTSMGKNAKQASKGE